MYMYVCVCVCGGGGGGGPSTICNLWLGKVQSNCHPLSFKPTVHTKAYMRPKYHTMTILLSYVPALKVAPHKVCTG